ncbi:iron chelate uptake ABC transporter family permease subunit [Streptomyces lanatus]|uniref:Iron chelate uptake ABC transporter family permease subunit n=1 Tax=Streptomyces lanatus TaxID=66900 RepID=A0ABV1XJS0_9ACTN|nr:iron chelate uptake ABC transporter family permease subunit [Streptomyces lanatus]GHG95209.1 hypothetical protein GCM10018780_18430 [Streptomyces lanatus]
MVQLYLTDSELEAAEQVKLWLTGSLDGRGWAQAGPSPSIGFVALTAPQLARRLTRTPQLPLLGSAATGAIVLVAADLVARIALPPLEIPVGALTALVGGGRTS